MPEQSLTQKLEIAAKAVLATGGVAVSILMGHEGGELKAPGVSIVATRGEEILDDSGIYSIDLDVTVEVHLSNQEVDFNDVVAVVTSIMGQPDIEELLTSGAIDFHVYEVTDSPIEPANEGALKRQIVAFEVIATQKDLT